MNPITGEKMKIIFLGTNGWYCTDTGNATCTLIDAEKYYVILDAGEGIYKIDKYVTTAKPIHLFLSHLHLDHISGMHTLNKFEFKQGLRIYGQVGTKNSLSSIIAPPFTQSINKMPYRVEIEELTEGVCNVPFPVTCKLLVHRDSCFGYRFDLDGKVVAYCTDTGVCDSMLELAADADVFISECSLKSGQNSKTWPHMNPEDAAETAKKARVKKLVLTHFDANVYRTMKERKEAERNAKRIFKNTIGAVDGMELKV